MFYDIPSSREHMTTTSECKWLTADQLVIMQDKCRMPQYLLAFEGVQDGKVAWVLQCEDDDFACVVKSWSSGYE